MERVGFFGGTFDPPHIGHLVLAEEARYQLGLDRVLWALAADPAHKRTGTVTPVADRLDMLSAAIRDNPAFELTRVDLDRPGPHWTIDALALLQDQHPTAALVVVVGGDSLRDLPTWKRAAELVEGFHFGVMRRPADRMDLNHLEHDLPGLSAKVDWINAPLIEVSASDIRRRVASAQPYRYLVPEGVARIIDERGLYRDEVDAGRATAPG